MVSPDPLVLPISGVMKNNKQPPKSPEGDLPQHKAYLFEVHNPFEI
jgi:hypothetical protein